MTQPPEYGQVPEGQRAIDPDADFLGELEQRAPMDERRERAAYLATRIDFRREFPVNTHTTGPCYVCREPVQPHRDLVAWSLEGKGSDTYPAVDLHAGCLADVKRAREDASVTVSWITNEIREYKATFTGVELRAAGLRVSNGRLEQTEPPQSHWETPDRFLASHEGPGTQKAGYIESRIAEAYPAGIDAECEPEQGESASPRLPSGRDFTGAPVAQRNTSRADRPPGSRVAPNAGQAPPGRLR